MRILVTGGAGYIGSHTCVELLNAGYEIIVADNFSNSSPEALRRISAITGKAFPFFEMDVCDSKGLAQVFQKHAIDAAVHFAGCKAVGESVEKPLKYYQNNLGSTLVLLETMLNHGVKKLVFSSSATVYRGDNAMPLNEEAALGCSNPYGWTKFMCEQIIADVSRAVPDFCGILLRYFNPVGAHKSGLIGEDPVDIPNNLMPYISQTAIGSLPALRVFGQDYPTADGTGIRDYIHVVDLAVGHVRALEYVKTHSGIEVFNLGTGKGYSVLEMVRAFEEANGVKVPYEIAGRRAGDLAECYADASKAEHTLGWKAHQDIMAMCRDAWRWQQKNPNGYRRNEAIEKEGGHG